MPSVDGVRAALQVFRTGTLMTYPHDVIFRFADAVLTPPTSVRLAIHAKRHGPNRKLANEIIADWVVSLIGPNAKETT